MEQRRLGRYRLVRLLGSGGMGKVYEAFDDQLGRRVALKGLLTPQTTSTGRERLRREAQATARLSHPAIAQVYGLEQIDGEDWLAMEMVDGKPVADLLEDGPLPVEDVARIGLAVAEALAAAHREGIVHRDVKAENVMLTPDGRVKVLDFGLVKWKPVSLPSSDSLTADGLVVGTSRAMSPEQALGRDVDPRSDVFSLGSLLWEMAVGEPAFSGGTTMEVMLKVARCERPRLDEVAPSLPRGLAEIIERCLQLNPDRRFASATEVAARLAGLLARPTHTTAFLQLATRLHRRILRRRWLWRTSGAAGVLAAALIVALAAGWLGAGRLPAIAVLAPLPAAAAPGAPLAEVGVCEAIWSTVCTAPELAPIDPEELGGIATQGLSTAEVGRVLGADWVVESHLVPGSPPLPDALRVALVEVRSGRVRASIQAEIDTRDLQILVAAAAKAMLSCLEQVGVAASSASLLPAEPALRPFLRARERLSRGGTFTLDEEAAELESAASGSPSPSVLLALARVHARRFARDRVEGADEAARALVRRALGATPSEPRRLLDAAAVLVELGDATAALALAQQGTEAVPGDARSWYLLGRAHALAGQATQSERALTRSLSLRSSWPALVTTCELSPKQTSVALLQPPHPALVSFHTWLADSLLASGRLIEARELLSPLQSGSPGTACELMGRYHLIENRTDLALESFSACAAAHPDDPTPLLWHGTALMWSHDPDAARRSFARALALGEQHLAGRPRSPRLLRARAVALAYLQRPLEAIPALHEALRSLPESPLLLLDAARVHALAGDQAAAASWAQRALDAGLPPQLLAGPELAAIPRP